MVNLLSHWWPLSQGPRGEHVASLDVHSEGVPFVEAEPAGVHRARCHRQGRWNRTSGRNDTMTITTTTATTPDYQLVGVVSCTSTAGKAT